MSSDANKVADMLKGAEDAQKQQQQQRDRKRKRESAEELPKKLRAKAEVFEGHRSAVRAV